MTDTPTLSRSASTQSVNFTEEENSISPNSSSSNIISQIKPAFSNEQKAAFIKTIESLKDPNVVKRDKLEALNKLVEYSELVTDLSSIVPIDVFLKSLRIFVVHVNKTLRTASLRVLRYYMKDEQFVVVLLKLKIHFFIARSLNREKQNEAERMQALKLVRKIMEINCSLLHRCIVHSLVSIGENLDDNFNRVAVETICEITIRNPRLSAHCRGIKLMLNAILDPNLSVIQESLLLALVYLLNNEETRKYIRPSLDLAILLGPLSDNFNPKDYKTPEKEMKWNASIKAVVSLLKTWTGLIGLASHPLGIKSLVNSLRLPAPELHDKVLDALFDIFRLTVAKDSNPFQFKAQNRPVDDTTTPDSGMDIGQELPSRTRGERHNLLNNYLSALLIIFLDCGLVECLVELGSKRKDNSVSEQQVNISIKATLLLGEMLYLTNTLLPPSQCARVQTLPKLVEYAASFDLDPRLRSRASSMVTNLHQYHHLKHTNAFYDFHLTLIVTGANKWKRLKGRDRRLDRMDEIKMKIDFAMDFDQFKNKISETQVLATKDYQRWKWDIIGDLFEGPFNNPNLVAYALKTKFVKRILSFLRPSHSLLSKMPWSAKNLRYVRMACQLLEALASSDIGRDHLKEINPKLISEIADQLKLEVDIFNQKEDSKKEGRLLSPEGVLKTMSREYFTMLGTLSSSTRGIEILNKFKIFKYLIDLTEMQGRVDISHLIMTSLDYNMAAGDSRVILGKSLTSASKVVRYLATRHMGILLRAGVQDFSEWGIDLLVKQLNDPDQKVTRSALNILDEACDEVECMDSLILKRPQVLLKLGQAGKDLYLRFLSRPGGFKYLSEQNFVNEELNLWKTQLTRDYVVSVETALAEAFSPAIYKHRESDHGGDGVYLSPHFYGELTKTKEGADLLENSKHFPYFISLITPSNNNNIDPLDIKAALLAIGHIGSTKYGFKFLERTNAVQSLVKLAETSPSLSIRGTCFYVLGMLSRSETARELLDQCGWESPANLNSSICVPKDVRNSSFFKLLNPKYEGSFAVLGNIEYPNETNEQKKEILTAVCHLSNEITAESASRNLRRLKELHPEHFGSPPLLYQVFKLLGTYKYRLNVRRFIYDIFDTAVMDDEGWSAFDELPE